MVDINGYVTTLVKGSCRQVVLFLIVVIINNILF
jgi:hypothetical protein